MRAFAMFTILLLANGAHASDLDALVAAERAFAASSPKLGVKAAFLGVLADDAIVFRPGATHARTWYAGRPDTAPFRLEWAPAAAEAADDLGYTFGPYRLTPIGADGSDGAPAGGQFFSVWVLREGRWRLLLDNGIEHALQELPGEAKDRAAGTRAVEGGDEAALRSADDQLNALRATTFDLAAWRALSAADAIELRSGQPPRAAVDLRDSAPMRARAERVLLRRSGDGRLAATAGVTTGDRPQSYQRVWRHQSEGWRLVVDQVGD